MYLTKCFVWLFFLPSLSLVHVCLPTSAFIYATLTVVPSVLPFSACPRYRCGGLCRTRGGFIAMCDTGVVRGSACISTEMPPSPRRHHWFFVCSHCRLPPWQLQAFQTGWVHTHTKLTDTDFSYLFHWGNCINHNPNITSLHIPLQKMRKFSDNYSLYFYTSIYFKWILAIQFGILAEICICCNVICTYLHSKSNILLWSVFPEVVFFCSKLIISVTKSLH